MLAYLAYKNGFIKLPVWNKHNPQHPKDGVFIGRPSKWGNPFVIGRDGDRTAVVAAYENYLKQNDVLLEQIDALRGRELICFCAPSDCHGDVLHRIANMNQFERLVWQHTELSNDDLTALILVSLLMAHDKGDDTQILIENTTSIIKNIWRNIGLAV